MNEQKMYLLLEVKFNYPDNYLDHDCFDLRLLTACNNLKGNVSELKWSAACLAIIKEDKEIIIASDDKDLLKSFLSLLKQQTI
jgi:hypothetical protein